MIFFSSNPNYLSKTYKWIFKQYTVINLVTQTRQSRLYNNISLLNTLQNFPPSSDAHVLASGYYFYPKSCLFLIFVLGVLRSGADFTSWSEQFSSHTTNEQKKKNVKRIFCSDSIVKRRETDNYIAVWTCLTTRVRWSFIHQ